MSNADGFNALTANFLPLDTVARRTTQPQITQPRIAARQAAESLAF
ncbi:MAG: hypothetical protein RLZZ282_1828, partial [Verrucomicrobiota bacterium]